MPSFKIDCHLHYRVIQATEFIFQFEAANHPWQTCKQESFEFQPQLDFEQYERDGGLNRLIRLHAPEGELRVSYHADVDTHIPERNTALRECEIHELPSYTLFYLGSSRFCESDLIGTMVQNTFGELPKGYARVQPSVTGFMTILCIKLDLPTVPPQRAIYWSIVQVYVVILLTWVLRFAVP